MRISDWSSDVCSSDLRLRAADLMEAAAADIEARGGRFTIIGTDRSMSFEEVAAASADPIAFDESGTFEPPSATFPNGAHVCELEVDPETGDVEIVEIGRAHV